MQTGTEAILLSVADSLEIPRSMELSQAQLCRSPGLGETLFKLPSSIAWVRRAQGLYTNLLHWFTQNPSTSVAAQNASGEGMINGMFSVLETYRADSDRPHGSPTPPPAFIDPQGRIIHVSAACAFPALQILRNVARDPRNRVLVASHKRFLGRLGAFMNAPQLHRSFLKPCLELVLECAPVFPALRDNGEMDVLIGALLSRLEEAATVDMMSPVGSLETCSLDNPPDFEISALILPALGWYSRGLSLHSRPLSRTVALTCRLMQRLECVGDGVGLAFLAHNLVERFAKIVSADPGFVRGLLTLLRDERSAELAAKTLMILHKLDPIQGYAEEVGLMSQWHQHQRAGSHMEAAALSQNQGSMSPQERLELSTAEIEEILLPGHGEVENRLVGDEDQMLEELRRQVGLGHLTGMT